MNKFFESWNLGAQFLGHWRSVRLVIRRKLHSERWFPNVKDKRAARSRVFLMQFDQKLGHRKDCIAGFPERISQITHRIESTVYLRISVYQKQCVRHCISLLFFIFKSIQYIPSCRVNKCNQLYLPQIIRLIQENNQVDL